MLSKYLYICIFVYIYVHILLEIYSFYIKRVYSLLVCFFTVFNSIMPFTFHVILVLSSLIHSPILNIVVAGGLLCLFVAEIMLLPPNW